MNDVEVKFKRHSFHLIFGFVVALEEYENLKRLPDPRQVAMERFQQQQRLNAQIAQQNAAAAQLRPNLQQTFHPINGRNTQFDRLFQHWQMNGLLNSIVNPHRSTGLFFLL